MRGRLWAALFCIALLAACAEPSTSPSAGQPPPETTGRSLDGWPDTGTGAASCAVDYPEDLDERENAFDGTIEKVELGEFDEDAQATPARLEVRINELFRGQLDGFVVMRTWDFMLPEGRDVTGVRILAAAGTSLDLMGCGFTRPYSESDAAKWREIYAALPPEECGKEVRDCSLGDTLSAPPANCDRASQEAAIAFNIDKGSYPFSVLGCNDRYMALRVDLGSDDCPPEATKEQREECADLNTAYFVAQDGTWGLITYEERTDCANIQGLDPSFPTAFCKARGG